MADASGFYGAFWRRPEAYLDANVRAGISVFAQLAVEEVDAALTALAADLKSGQWHEAHRKLLRLDQLDLGYYVVVVEVGGG